MKVFHSIRMSLPIQKPTGVPPLPRICPSGVRWLVFAGVFLRVCVVCSFRGLFACVLSWVEILEVHEVCVLSEVEILSPYLCLPSPFQN